MTNASYEEPSKFMAWAGAKPAITAFWFGVLFAVIDFVATIQVLSHEPGISGRDVYVYSIELLPGSLLLVDSGEALLFNVIFGAVVGLGVGLVAKRSLRRRAELR